MKSWLGCFMLTLAALGSPSALAWKGEQWGPWVDVGLDTHLGGWQSPRRNYPIAGVWPAPELRVGWGLFSLGFRTLFTGDVVDPHTRFAVRPILIDPVGVVFAWDLDAWRGTMGWVGAEIAVPRTDRFQAHVLVGVTDTFPLPDPRTWEVGMRWRAW